MSSFVSRILVTVVALPVVLYVVWLGGWWLTGLAIVGALIALHELYAMARSLRPLVLAGYAGAILALVGAAGGRVRVDARPARWRRCPLAFVLYGIGENRQSATVAIGTTMLGVVWIPVGLGVRSSCSGTFPTTGGWPSSRCCSPSSRTARSRISWGA